MDICLESQTDSIIADLGYVVQTRNAYKTYKKFGWKSSFMKYKKEALEEIKNKDKSVRNQCRQDLKASKSETAISVQKFPETQMELSSFDNIDQNLTIVDQKCNFHSKKKSMVPISLTKIDLNIKNEPNGQNTDRPQNRSHSPKILNPIKTDRDL